MSRSIGWGFAEGIGVTLLSLTICIGAAVAKCGDFSIDVCDSAGNFVPHNAAPDAPTPKNGQGPTETLAARLASIEASTLTFDQNKEGHNKYYTDTNTVFCINDAKVGGLAAFTALIGKTVTVYTNDHAIGNVHRPRYAFRVEDDSWIKAGTVQIGGQSFTRVLKSPQPGEACGKREPMSVGD